MALPVSRPTPSSQTPHPSPSVASGTSRIYRALGALDQCLEHCSPSQTCAKGTHTSEVPLSTSAPSSAPTAPDHFVSEDGVETYGVAPAPPTRKAPSGTATPTLSNTAPPETAEPTKVVVEEDDLSIPVPDGARCKRLGCGAEWEGQDVSRGEGEKAKCRHHPQAVSAAGRWKRFDGLVLTPRAARVPRRIERISVLQAACARV